MGKKKYIELSDFDKENIKYYYGIPHCHTDFSTGKGTPIEIYESAYKSGLDFIFITDHNSYLSSEITLKDRKYSKFKVLKIYSNKIRKKYEDFLPLIGFEAKTNLYGDLNIINTNTFFTGVVKDFKVLTLWMLNNPNSFISINHPHKNILELKYNPILNKIITSIEVGNGTENKYTRHDKYYFNLLDAGWQLGAINGQDNHKINFLENENLTVCICNSLSTNNIISAFRERRTYSTESKHLKLYFTINDAFMGEEMNLEEKSKLKFMIFAEDVKYKINSISILSNNGKVIKNIDSIGLNSIKYLYEHKREANECWYVIKVIQDNNKIAFTSPIFIN